MFIQGATFIPDSRVYELLSPIIYLGTFHVERKTVLNAKDLDLHEKTS